MQKNILTLIKLTKKNLDENLALIRKTEKKQKEIERKIDHLIVVKNDEIKKFAAKIDWRERLNLYVTYIDKKIYELKNQLSQIQSQLDLYFSKHQEYFADLKKFEIIDEKILEQKKIQETNLENKSIDEMNIVKTHVV